MTTQLGCTYCGSMNHKLSNCPIKKEESKAKKLKAWQERGSSSHLEDLKEINKEELYE